MGTNTRAGEHRLTQITLYVGFPIVIVMAASLMAHAYDTTWIAPQQQISSSKLKADLDEIQMRLAALEKEGVYRATLGVTGEVVAQTGSWISVVNHPSPGNFVISFAAGAFSALPTCVATAIVGNASPPSVECFNVAMTSITCQATVDTNISLVCVGPK